MSLDKPHQQEIFAVLENLDSDLGKNFMRYRHLKTDNQLMTSYDEDLTY